MIPDRSPDTIVAPCRYPCPGCPEMVAPEAYAGHIRGCVAIQARPLVEAAARVAGSPSFHLDTFLEVVWLAFELDACPEEAWGVDVLAKLPYVSRFEHGFYRYEGAADG